MIGILRRAMMPALVLAAICGCISPAAAKLGDWSGPGFLEFTRGNSIAKNSQQITVHVGLFAAEGAKPTADQNVWFYASFRGRAWTDPVRFRWTDGASCPAALKLLKEVRSIDMPTPVLPIRGEEEGEDPGIVVDGRDYSLDVSASSVSGQLNGAMHMESNMHTDLATWMDRMIDTLEPCWSTKVPEGVSDQRGQADWRAGN